ncbi:MAG: AAA family ATPase [Acidimicrobiaceae bacterium]|nr:AAA family ATPase [Acidimicrobiaceae bacterium]
MPDTSEDKPLPADQRPFDDTPISTANLPALPTRDRNISAEAWIEAPAALMESGNDIGSPRIAYKRRLGSWLLWRAGPARGADARYTAIHADDNSQVFTFRLLPNGTGSGIGPSGREHERLRIWKEDLITTNDPKSHHTSISGSDLHPDHHAEQGYLRHARATLEAMIERTQRVLEFSEQRVRDEDSVDAKIAQSKMVERLHAVNVGNVALCFGRIDEDPIIADGDQWYVGRRHIENADGRTVIVDWRAPVAIPFYRATAADAFGLSRRRRFSTEVDELVAIFDEHLDDPDSMSAAGIPDPVLAEIEQGRSGEMSDIVATIAAEQDEIIRAPLSECLLVQGGPGTGKTAVGLHRAAFLLFEHRAALAQSHVLVIGPNRVFLRYVSNVLPSLGETAVTQATITSLLSSRVRVRGEDSAAVTELKGRATMTQVLRRLADARIKVPNEEQAVPIGLRSVRFTPAVINAAMKTARNNTLPLNDAKGVFAQVLLREARQQLLDRGVFEEDLARILPDLRKSSGFKKMVDKIWPNLSGAQLVRFLLGSPTNRNKAIDGLLSPEEGNLLQRSSAKKIADEPWTAADLPLLDEGNAIASGGGRRYGHVVIDEAQDLSAMALRAAGRRATNASMTILGDIAQSTGIGAQESWDAVTTSLGIDGSLVRRRELTVGYRVPGPILEYANQLLPITAPDITPSTSIRSRGIGAEHHQVDTAAIGSTVAKLAADLGGEWSTIGVIAPRTHMDDVLQALAEAGLEAGDTRKALELDKPISVVDPPTAKGLEFDATIVVEPADFVDLPNGLRLLYVALTRPVQRLLIVRVGEMPSPL